ncbi:hypothetical protein [Egbenema bharatensis]|uniref:hypothetical protein n=1 Tax=Egbenema bharatensis TaxID=3463334 RepID=UPI003A848E0C
MNINYLLQTLPLRFRTLVKRVSFFALGTGLTLFYAQLVHAQGVTGDTPIRSAYSPATIIAALIGATITVFFVQGMYQVLTYASETYGLEDDEAAQGASHADNTLLWGAASWVVGSALLIASYAWGWGFLYLGPIICLLGPIVPIVAMRSDVKRYRKILADRTARRAISEQEGDFIRRF